ncbi:MAG: penicillin-binding transpeptidase domain-containing protein, partial [Verrucomicrobiota bacterium]
GFYGVNAASKGYFGKEVSDISIDEAAVICGLIRSPNRLSPFNNLEASTRERNRVLDRMVAEHMITKGQADELKESDVQLVAERVARKESFDYAYEQVRQQVVAQIGFEQASEGGFHIYTTIDSSLQLQTQKRLVEHLNRIEHQHLAHSDEADHKQTYEEFDKILKQWNKDNPASAAKSEDGEEAASGPKRPRPEYLQGAALVIDNKTGAVRALVGGRDFAHSAYDRTLLARRKPGTAFKPFVYAAGFSRSKFPGSKVDDSPLDNRFVMIGGETGIVPEYGAESATNNYEKYMPARNALIKGKNAATVRFGIEVGLENVVQLARDAGIVFEGDIQNYNSTFLGNSEASVAEMALAYTIFPNGGKRPNDIFIIDQIRDMDGNKIYSAQTEEPDVEVLDPYSAYQVHSALAQSLKTGTAAKARNEFGLGDYPAAAKTGTAYDFKDDWVVGYTSEVTCAVWSGFDKAATIYHGAFANETVLPLWTDIINDASDRFTPQPISPPSDAIRVELCTVSGDRATDYCYHIEVIDGEEQQVRDSYVEFLNPKYQFRRDCAVHGPGGRLNLQLLQPLRADPILTDRTDSRKILRPGDYELNLQPVFLQAQTVMGPDPYNSVKLAAIRPRILAPPPPPSETTEETEQPGEEPLPEDQPPAAVSESDPAASGEPIRPTIIEPTPLMPADDDAPAPIFSDEPAPIFSRDPIQPVPVPDPNQPNRLQPFVPDEPRPGQPDQPTQPNNNGAPGTTPPPAALPFQPGIQPRERNTAPRPARVTEDGLPSILDEQAPERIRPPRAEPIEFD